MSKAIKLSKLIRNSGFKTQTAYAAFLSTSEKNITQQQVSRWIKKDYRAIRVSGKLKLYAPIRDLPETEDE